MERIYDNLLFRWFVGLPTDAPVWMRRSGCAGMDAPVWRPTVFTKNRDRLLEADVTPEFLSARMDLPRVKRLLSDERFTVDGALIDAWDRMTRASMKSFRRKGGEDEPPAPGRSRERNFHGDKRSNATHASTIDPDARLYRKGDGQEQPADPNTC